MLLAYVLVILQTDLLRGEKTTIAHFGDSRHTKKSFNVKWRT